MTADETLLFRTPAGAFRYRAPPHYAAARRVEDEANLPGFVLYLRTLKRDGTEQLTEVRKVDTQADFARIKAMAELGCEPEQILEAIL